MGPRQASANFASRAATGGKWSWRSKLAAANAGSNDVSVIDIATNTVTATIPVGTNPLGVAVTPDGSKVYVANFGDDNVSVINTATKTAGDA
jgi:YVTN family beta-propeller protein